MTNLSDKYKNSLPFESSNITTIVSNYTASNNETVFVNSASSALTVTLPASPTQGSKIKVLDIATNSQNNNITVLGNGNNIGGASAYIINTPDSSVEVMYINTIKGWNILNEYISITKPGSPTGVSAVDVGTGREFNNGAATVSFTPSTEGDLASSYTVVSSPGSYTETGISSPIVVTGLQSNTSYTFTVIGSNAAGFSAASTASSSITATTVPQAPTINSATHGFEKVSVAFTANATGGKAISSFTVTPSGGATPQSNSSSPISVTSLTAGTAYTFTTTATNENGTSLASTSSGSATPFTATGGTITTSGSYRYHTFNGSSNFILSGNNANITYVIVAGGAGAGTGSGDWAPGGGGAGGLLNSSTNVGANSYSITVGGGGSSATNGINSSALGITSIGGGKGSSGTPQPDTPGSGGSGGGGGGVNSASNGGAGTAGQGFAGGNGIGSDTGSVRRGGGGGGAGNPGGSITPGPGLDVSAFLNQSLTTTYLAGGGAGKFPFAQNATGGIGGGGGSNGSTATGGNGTTNTGGGGGATGGLGGSGKVILRYEI